MSSTATTTGNHEEIKIVLALAIFAIGLGSVLAPQQLVASESAQHWFSLGNMAASGVLLSGGLVHMLADAAEVLDFGQDFPMANFIAGLTFIGFMVLEESLHLLFMMNDNNEDSEGCCEDDDDGGKKGFLQDLLMVSHDHGHGIMTTTNNNTSKNSRCSHSVGSVSKSNTCGPQKKVLVENHDKEKEEDGHSHKEAIHHNHQEGESSGHHDHSHKGHSEDSVKDHDHSHQHENENNEQSTTGDSHNHHSHDHQHNENEKDDHHDHNHPHKDEQPEDDDPAQNSETRPLLSPSTSSHGHGPHHHHHNYDSLPFRSLNASHNNISMSIRRTACNSCVGSYAPHTYSHSQPHVTEDDHHHHHNDEHHSTTERRPSLLSVAPQHHHHHHDDHLELHLHGSCLAAGVLMLALSIHSILAGVSIGIEGSAQTIASTAIAILAHKSFEGFCLGSSLVSAQIGGTTFWSLSLWYAFMTPLGILIGQLLVILIAHDMEADDVEGNHAIAVVQAMVAGTFLYIAIVEIGGKELLACRHDTNQHGSKWQKQVDAAKLVCFIIGFLAMSSLALYV